MELELYDATLREGEQAAGVSFSLKDRVEIVKALDNLGIEFIEAGWPIHQDVLDAFLEINRLVENGEIRAKIVAFGATSIVDNPEQDINLKSIVDSKVKYACIFGKTWIEHIEKQLKLTKEQNLDKIKKSIEFLRDKGIEVLYDAEHYFDGFKANSDYSMETIEQAMKAGATRIILCDTNGGSLPEEVEEILEKTKEFLGNRFKGKLGVHIHNDSALALSNSLLALKYVDHVQGTINGLGERVGNLDLCEFIPLLMLKKGLILPYKLDKLRHVSDLVYKAANIPKKINQAFISQRAYSHKGGVHIDAMTKGASYSNVTPEDFGLEHSLILTSLGGAACIVAAADKFGFTIDKRDENTKEKINQALDEIKKLEKQGYDIGDIEAEQYMILSRYFGEFKQLFEVKEWEINTGEKNSSCTLTISIDGQERQICEKLEGGPVGVLYKALVSLIKEKYPEIEKLKIRDYKVRVAKSEGEESSVRTRIAFTDSEDFSTVGVSTNIIGSGLEALEKAFNYYLNKFKSNKD